MLPHTHLKYLTDNGFTVSELRTESIYWIYSDEFNIAVKDNCYDVFRQNWGSLELLASICCKLELDSFIVLMDGLAVVKINCLV